MPRCFPKIRHPADRCRQSVAHAVQVSMLHRGSSTWPSDESGTARAQQIGALYASHLATATVVAVARHPELFRLGAHYVWRARTWPRAGPRHVVGQSTCGADSSKYAPPLYLAIWPISGGGEHAGTNDEVTILGVSESRAVGR
jgi:hypothetical protein